MIDVSQWRASIGLWNYCQAASSRPANGGHSHSFKEAVDSKLGSTTSEEKTSKLPAALSLIAFLLFHSLSLLRHILMIPPRGNCYQVQCITGVTITVINYFQSVVLPGGSSFNLIHNDFYLIVCLHALLLLSGDVELNPGPMIDVRPDMSLLIQWLQPLVDWKAFGFCLTEISRHDVLKIEQDCTHVQIEDKKLALYSKWLSVDPNATWRNVIDALTSIKENTLAQGITNQIASDALSTVSSLSPRTSNSDGDIEIIFFRKEDQEVQDSLTKLQKNFSHLMTKIKSAFRKKVTDNDELPTKISDWVESYLHLEPSTVHNDLDDIFKKIYHYYDFSDCSLIVAMCDEFISDTETDLLDQLHKYSEKADEFSSSEPITELKGKICKVYEPYRRHLEDMPLVKIKLQSHWNKVKINGLKILVESLLPEKLRHSVMKCITIEKGCVMIKLHILDFKADNLDSLIQYNKKKLNFIHLIGIFSLYINDYPVLQDDENMNFTFELALLEAVTVGNNEAVKFLLKLKNVNIDHTSDKGETALMLACKGGHEDIIHSLLSNGANVNIHNKGWTALMIASEYNHILIIHKLLKANANPHLKTKGRSNANALIIASYHGNYEVVQLLISKGVDYTYQQEDGYTAFMLACQNGHIQIAELLLKEKVDPNVQNEDGWTAFMMACWNGYTQIVELLLKKNVNPDIRDKNGQNGFMLACGEGHTQIVELLLKEKVNSNIQEKNGWDAFMLACAEGHIKIVELLLKKNVNYNIREKNGQKAFILACENGHTEIVELLLKKEVGKKKDKMNAFILACKNGHNQIVELLLKEKVDPNGHGQNEDNWTAFMMACWNGHTQIVKLLLNKKINPNVRDKNGQNAFMLACENGQTEIVELLLQEQVRLDPNVQDRKGYTPLMIASAKGHVKIVKLLLDWLADPEIKARDSSTALSLAKTREIADILHSLDKYSSKQSLSGSSSARSSDGRSSFSR